MNTFYLKSYINIAYYSTPAIVNKQKCIKFANNTENLREQTINLLFLIDMTYQRFEKS